MDIREKLVELLDDMQRSGTGYFGSAIENKKIADYLIRHGVTVQDWVSVKDRMPEYPGHYLVCTSINYWYGGCMDINENHKYYPNGTPVGYDGTTMSVLDCYYDVTGHWNRVCDSHVTHWMPLPEPPEALIKEDVQ